MIVVKLRPNDRNMPIKHIATLLGAACCVRLGTVLYPGCQRVVKPSEVVSGEKPYGTQDKRVATCWVFVCWLNFENGQS